MALITILSLQTTGVKSFIMVILGSYIEQYLKTRLMFSAIQVIKSSQIVDKFQPGHSWTISSGRAVMLNGSDFSGRISLTLVELRTEKNLQTFFLML